MSGAEARIPGVLLRLQPVAEADLIATLLGPAHGRVEVYARNARASSKRFGGRLEAFAQGVARLQRGRGHLPLLAGFDPGPPLFAATLDYPRLVLASHAAELALASAQPDHQDPGLHAWICGALRALGAGGPPPDVAAARIGVEVGWLLAIGAAPPLTACSGCGRDLSAGACWPRPHDGLRCLACADHGSPDITGDDLALLQALVRDPAARGAAPSIGGARLLRHRVAGLVDEQLGRRTRSAAALQALAAGSPAG